MNGEQDFFIQYTVKKKCRKTQIKRIQVYFSFGEMQEKTAIINAGGGFVMEYM